MSGIIKMFLLLAGVVCFTKAQFNGSGQQCLCQRLRRPIGSKSEIKDIQIYPATVFCDRVEIVVTLNRGFRYCLNPQLNVVKKVLATIMRKQESSANTPTELASKPASTKAAGI